MSLPSSRINPVVKYHYFSFLMTPDLQSTILFPLRRVLAGFPSPSEEPLEGSLNLNAHLIKNPSTTFFMRVKGDSMKGAGIYDSDIMIVDRSLTAQHNSIIVAVIGGEMIVKRLYQKEGKILLLSENPSYLPLAITQEMNLCIWGVVTTVIHSVS